MVFFRTLSVLGVCAAASSLSALCDVALSPLLDGPVDVGLASPPVFAATTPTMADADPDASEGASIARAADGLFYVNAVVNGQRIRFVVDTGSSVVVLSRADAKKAGVDGAPGKFDQEMQTAGGATRMRWARLDHVRVNGRALTRVRAAIVEDGLPVSLMGQEMLSKLGSMHIDGDTLILG